MGDRYRRNPAASQITLMQYLRTSTDILLFVALFIAPWWIVALGALAAAFAFDFPELIILAFLYDLMYAASAHSAWQVPFLLTISACLVYGILTLLKSYTLLNE